ncbi:MAG: HAD-IB family hydrolase [Acidimicrobiia bacterium]
MTGAAFFDLDRTLLQGASGPLISSAMRAEGILPDKPIRGEGLVFGIFNVIGETLPSMALTRLGIRATKGWSVEAFKAAGQRVAPALAEAVEPFAKEILKDHHHAGRKIVLATTTPYEMVKPFADLMGFDAVLATKYRSTDGKTYDGSVDGEFVWNRGKARLVKAWAKSNLVELAESYAYSDSIFDLPMLRSVGFPAAVNPDPRLWALTVVNGWPVLYFTAPPGVPKPLGIEPQRVVSELVRPEFLPWVRIDVEGLENLDDVAGVLITPNHRSYVDPMMIAQAISRVNRPVRFLSKKEVTDAPVVGPIAQAMGAIRVDRQDKTGDPMAEAARALRAGEVVAVFPQGTIPRGHEFFDPELKGRYGAVRLALDSGAPLVPIGLWGTERVWPRNRKLPYVLNVAAPPQVTVKVGDPYHPETDDLDAETEVLMQKIVELLPPEARVRHEPTKAELERTMPT